MCGVCVGVHERRARGCLTDWGGWRQGHEVIVLDNMFTGRKKNVAHWIGHPHFMLIVHDVVEPIMLEVRWVVQGKVDRL